MSPAGASGQGRVQRPGAEAARLAGDSPEREGGRPQLPPQGNKTRNRPWSLRVQVTFGEGRGRAAGGRSPLPETPRVQRQHPRSRRQPWAPAATAPARPAAPTLLLPLGNFLAQAQAARQLGETPPDRAGEREPFLSPRSRFLQTPSLYRNRQILRTLSSRLMRAQQLFWTNTAVPTRRHCRVAAGQMRAEQQRA